MGGIVLLPEIHFSLLTSPAHIAVLRPVSTSSTTFYFHPNPSSRGVVLSPAVIPIGLTVTWSKLTKPAVFAGACTGFVLGMTAWMVGCLKIYGERDGRVVFEMS
jgi:hypothetical protein